MNERMEQRLGGLAKAALDARAVSPEVAAKLAQARQRAVAHAGARGGFNPLRWLSEQFGAHPAAWGAGLAFGLAVVVGGTWQWQHARAVDPSLDLQLLADEAPLDIYVSNDFDKWTTATN
ncbi:hypothetical protein YWS52_31050 [Chitiniphilus shinanonensis]